MQFIFCRSSFSTNCRALQSAVLLIMPLHCWISIRPFYHDLAAPQWDTTFVKHAFKQELTVQYWIQNIGFCIRLPEFQKEVVKVVFFFLQMYSSRAAANRWSGQDLCCSQINWQSLVALQIRLCSCHVASTWKTKFRSHTLFPLHGGCLLYLVPAAL